MPSPTSSEGKRWTLKRREAEPGHEPGRWRVDYDSERLWGFEYEVAVPASEVERLEHELAVKKGEAAALWPKVAEVERLTERNAEADELLATAERIWRDGDDPTLAIVDLVRSARAALHPDEPKEKE